MICAGSNFASVSLNHYEHIFLFQSLNLWTTGNVVQVIDLLIYTLYGTYVQGIW